MSDNWRELVERLDTEGRPGGLAHEAARTIERMANGLLDVAEMCVAPCETHVAIEQRVRRALNPESSHE